MGGVELSKISVNWEGANKLKWTEKNRKFGN